MLLIPTYIKSSPIHGVGLFSRDLIPAHTKIWEFNAFIDKVITASHVISLPFLIQQFIYDYAYLYKGNWVLCLDNARCMNHSFQPNTYAQYNTYHGEDYASQDILPDTEITANYTLWDESAALKLT